MYGGATTKNANDHLGILESLKSLKWRLGLKINWWWRERLRVTFSISLPQLRIPVVLDVCVRTRAALLHNINDNGNEAQSIETYRYALYKSEQEKCIKDERVCA